MRRRIRTQSQHRRSGAALVEFALIAPVFLTLVLGSIEMGNALDTSNLMLSGLREGGRLATMDWKDTLPNGMTANQKVIADITNFYKAAGLPVDEMTITITAAEGSNAGNTFDLSDPDNSLQTFKLQSEVLYSNVNSSTLTYMGGQTLKASLVFRAGRIK